MKKKKLLKSIKSIKKDIKELREEHAVTSKEDIAYRIRDILSKSFDLLSELDQEILDREVSIKLSDKEQRQIEEKLKKMSSNYKKLEKELENVKGLNGLEDIIESNIDAVKCYITSCMYKEVEEEIEAHGIDSKDFILVNKDILEEGDICQELYPSLENLVNSITILFVKEGNQYIINWEDETESIIYCIKHAIITAYKVAIFVNVSEKNVDVDQKRLKEIIEFLKTFKNFYSKAETIPYRTVIVFLDALIKCLEE